MKSKTMLTLSCILCTTTVSAHGPTRQKLEQTIEINAPAEKVWTLIKNYNDLSWLPGVLESHGETPVKEGAKRYIKLQQGGVITEELKKYDESAMRYSYRITEMSSQQSVEHLGEMLAIPVIPVHDFSATLEVKNNGANKAQVTWKAGYYRAYMNNLTQEGEPKAMNEATANQAVESMFKRGLANLKRRAEE